MKWDMSPRRQGGRRQRSRKLSKRSATAGSASRSASGARSFLALIPARCLDLRWAFGAGIADRIQHLGDRGGGRLGQETRWRIVAGDFQTPLAGVRICPVLHPAVVLTLADRACLLQNSYRPPP